MSPDQNDREPTVPGEQFAGMNLDLMSSELSSRRTGLSFQRTRMSADRTLMSVIHVAGADRLWLYDLQRFSFAANQRAVGGAHKRRAQLWTGVDNPRRGPALLWHPLPRSIHETAA